MDQHQQHTIKNGNEKAAATAELKLVVFKKNWYMRRKENLTATGSAIRQDIKRL